MFMFGMYGEEIAPLVAGGVALGMFYKWFWAGEIDPDPWESPEQSKAEDDEDEPACQRCLSIVLPESGFCPKCGAIIDPLCAFLPLASCFALGDVIRSGLYTKGPLGPLIWWGYSLIALANFSCYAPLYLFFFARNRRRLSP